MGSQKEKTALIIVSARHYRFRDKNEDLAV